MSKTDRAAADAHAAAARQAIERGTADGDPLDLAASEALLAIFHQLRAMDDGAITLKGAADLSNAMDALSRKLPDQ